MTPSETEGKRNRCPPATRRHQLASPQTPPYRGRLLRPASRDDRGRSLHRRWSPTNLPSREPGRIDEHVVSLLHPERSDREDPQRPGGRRWRRGWPERAIPFGTCRSSRSVSPYRSCRNRREPPLGAMIRCTRRACTRLKSVFSCAAPSRRGPGSRVSSEALLRGRCSVSTRCCPGRAAFQRQQQRFALVGVVEVQMPDVSGLSRGVDESESPEGRGQPHPTRTGLPREAQPGKVRGLCPAIRMPGRADAAKRRQEPAPWSEERSALCFRGSCGRRQMPIPVAMSE